MTEGRFELDGAYTIDQIPDVRRFIAKLHASRADDEVVSRLAMATHELFENAVKFSADGIAAIRIDVTRGPARILISTRNRARPDDIGELRELAGQLRSATDMMGFYVELMRRSPGERGGLGLGRVAAEAEMHLELELDGDLVVVRAELELEGHDA